MKEATKEVLGLNFTIHNVPETETEFNTLAGTRPDGQSPVLFEASNNIFYRSTFPDIRAEFLERLEKLTGIMRKTKPGPNKKDGSAGADQYDETEGKYFARVCATFKPEGATEVGVDKKYFQFLADEVSSAKKTKKEGETTITLDEFLISFDPSAASRGTGETKIAKVYLDAASDFLKKDAAWQARAKANLEKLNPGVSIDENEDGTLKAESVAVAIKANEDRKRKSAVEELGAE